MRIQAFQSWDGRGGRALSWLPLLVLAAVSCTNDAPSSALSSEDPLPASSMEPKAPAAQPPANEVTNPPAKSPEPPVTTNPETKPPAKEPEPPAGPVYALQPVADCDEAEALIRKQAIADMNAKLDASKKQGSWQWCTLPSSPALPGGAPGAPPPPQNAPTSAPNTAADSSRAGSTSMTNNQVAGVDEADIIKNDTKYVYAAMNGALRIIEAWPAAQAHEIANVKLEGIAKKLFVLEDRALVYVSVPRTAPVNNTADRALPPSLPHATQSECTYGYDCEFGGDGTATALLVFDISDRKAPKQLRRIDLSGSLLAARRIGSAVHTVAVTPELVFPGVSYYPPGLGCSAQATAQDQLEKAYEELRKKNISIIESTDLGDFLPSVREGGNEYGANNCDALYRELAPSGAAFTSVVSVDLKTSDAPVVSTVLSKPGAVYASAEALYMAVIQDGLSTLPAVQGDSQKLGSKIHKFRIGADPKATAYLASGTVKGHVLNQFSMDEHQGYLRVATSWGKVPMTNVHSTISVIGQREHELALVGSVDNIAPMEDIRSVRFDGERGFIVTFKKTDPLYAFDLSKPSAPKITGELKIPGFSTYMHMLDDTHLLTIGYDAADQGNFAYFTGVLLQIFDVTDPTQLKLAHKTVIGTRGTSSEALTNHLAFTLFNGKLAVPMTICEGGDTNGSFGTNMTFSGLIVFDIGVDTGIKERGRVAHPMEGTSYDNAGCANWWTRAGSVVQRSVIMDDFVYSIALNVMRVQNLDMLGKDVAAVSLNQ